MKADVCYHYRAVALSSIYGKILDNIILSVQQEELKTSDLQFGYKSESSTIMCSTMVIETIQYFTACHSPIYVLYMDASKAFDRLYHIELFRLLSERAACPLILRLLFNMYRKQRIQVRWGDSLSDMFSMSNGVKQGAVLSPVLFTANLINFLKGSELLGLDAMLVKCIQEHLDMLMTWCY